MVRCSGCSRVSAVVSYPLHIASPTCLNMSFKVECGVAGGVKVCALKEAVLALHRLSAPIPPGAMPALERFDF